MARRRVRHLVVRRDDEIVGVLDAANVLSSLANQADPIGALIDRAQTPADLAEASERIGFLVRQLHDSGTKIGFITELSTDLHRRATAGLFAKLAPPGMAERACLVVMGSEGRGEYLTKTDQDNGIILADGYDPPDWEGFRHRFTAAMIDAGFPACPGEIMVRNPAWSKPLKAWCDDVRAWVLKPDEQALMNVAIFYDAAAGRGRRRPAGAGEGLSVRLARRQQRLPRPFRPGHRDVRHAARVLFHLRHREGAAQGRARPEEGRASSR